MMSVEPLAWGLARQALRQCWLVGFSPLKYPTTSERGPKYDPESQTWTRERQGGALSWV